MTEKGRIILFLEDDPIRAAIAYQRMGPDANRTMWCQNAGEAISVLEDYRESLELVSLDHDLEGEQYQDSRSENCGMEVVRYLEKLNSKQWKHVEFVIHSWNLKAGRRMFIRLLDAGYKVEHKPFGS